MKRLLTVLGILVALCVAYVVTHLALIEIGQEIVTLYKPTGEDSFREARLWIVDGDGSTWLHHGYADSDWIVRLGNDPIVKIRRDGELREYHGHPDRAADARVHQLLREKYGAADRLVRFWAGSDSEKGVATGATCQALPVRLDPL